MFLYFQWQTSVFSFHVFYTRLVPFEIIIPPNTVQKILETVWCTEVRFNLFSQDFSLIANSFLNETNSMGRVQTQL